MTYDEGCGFGNFRPARVGNYFQRQRVCPNLYALVHENQKRQACLVERAVEYRQVLSILNRVEISERGTKIESPEELGRDREEQNIHLI